MISIKRYTDNDTDIWNQFNQKSKNSLFMFDRNYMDYHRDRFRDHSLMFYKDGKLIAILPACEKEGVLSSHAGLTYGGFITDDKMKQHIMNDCMEALIAYSNELGINEIIYKTIPHIYHSQPAEEDRFSLYANGASIETIDVSSVVRLTELLKMSKDRKRHIARAQKEDVKIKRLTDFDSYNEFIEIENEVLETRHDTHAVHTAEELMMLHERFPNNIHLYGALKEGVLIAGVVVYEYDQVVHTQYMAANEEARKIGGLDLAVAAVIDKYKDTKLWLDFGISTEHGRVYLNEGLASQKEGFGGRTNVYSVWRLQI